MEPIGARLKWWKGKILHPARLWKSPSKRRIPRLLVENRAKEVGVLVYVSEPYIVFEETDTPVERIDQTDSVPLEFYLNRFHLLPARFKRQDTYEWIRHPGNALLLWATDKTYFVKTSKRSF